MQRPSGRDSATGFPAKRKGYCAGRPTQRRRSYQTSIDIVLDCDKIASLEISLQQVGGDLASLIGGQRGGRDSVCDNLQPSDDGTSWAPHPRNWTEPTRVSRSRHVPPTYLGALCRALLRSRDRRSGAFDRASFPSRTRAQPFVCPLSQDGAARHHPWRAAP